MLSVMVYIFHSLQIISVLVVYTTGLVACFVSVYWM
uniref:Uncharacterized protein n=1 Tax=Anguilla anguilla TaxID=7936 RepID=A0A0E9TBH7_ANGAN